MARPFILDAWDTVSGQGAARESRAAERLTEENRNYWQQMGREAPNYYQDAPSIEQLTGRVATVDPAVGLQGDSWMWDAYADQDSIDAQKAALSSLEGVYQAGGMTEADRANADMRMRRSAQAERGQREAVQSQMAQRGMGGSGAELAGVLSAQQGMMNTNADYEAQLQAEAQDRALRAMEGAGNLATNVRTGSWNEASTRADSQDSIDNFNADWMGRNATNNAASVNQNERDSGQAYRDQYGFRRSAAQQGFQDRMDVGDRVTGVTREQAQGHRDDAAAWDDQFGTYMQVGATVAGGPQAGQAVGALDEEDR